LEKQHLERKTGIGARSDAARLVVGERRSNIGPSEHYMYVYHEVKWRQNTTYCVDSSAGLTILAAITDAGCRSRNPV